MISNGYNRTQCKTFGAFEQKLLERGCSVWYRESDEDEVARLLRILTKHRHLTPPRLRLMMKPTQALPLTKVNQHLIRKPKRIDILCFAPFFCRSFAKLASTAAPRDVALLRGRQRRVTTLDMLLRSARMSSFRLHLSWPVLPAPLS